MSTGCRFPSIPAVCPQHAEQAESQAGPEKQLLASPIRASYEKHGASQMVLLVKNPPADARDVRDAGWIPGLGRSPGEGHGNPLQYSCLENRMDRGAWWPTVHGVTESLTQLKQLSMHAREALTFCSEY